MSRGTEITRLGLRRAGDQARGLNRHETRTIATRAVEISIVNRLMLPILLVPPGQADAPAAPAPQSSTGVFAFLDGYSAAAGTAEAVADATGRAGDTLRLAVAPTSGGSRGFVAPQILFPATAEATGGSTGTITPTIV
jgi:hypothetical protein